MKRLCSSYKSFCSQIEEIRKYIANTLSKNDSLSLLESNATTDKERSFISYLKSLNTSQIQCNAVIISLYGCFENYIDNLLADYISVVFEKTEDYESLPEKMKDKYRLKIGEYLSNPQRYKGWDISFSEIIKNYSDVLSSDFIDHVEKRFLCAHSGNLRTEELINLLTSIGISEVREKIISSAELRDYYINTADLEEDLYKAKVDRAKRDLNQTDLFDPLEQLVSQRNIVAHSWRDGERLSSNYLNENVLPFLKALSLNVLKICITELFCTAKEDEFDFQNRTPIAVYDNHILCINNQNIAINTGDLLLYISSNSHSGKKYLCSKILSIECDNVKISCVEANESIDIGMKLEEKIKQTDEVCFVINM